MAPTVEQGTLVFGFGCDGIDSKYVSPNEFSFTAASWQPVTVTVRAPGSPISANCWVWNDQNDYTQMMFPLVFGSPPVVTVDAPTFVTLGSVAPITLRTPAGLMFLPNSQSKVHVSCSHEGLRSEVIPMQYGKELYVGGMTAIELRFHADGRRLPVVEPNSVSGSRSPVTLALPRGKRAKTAAAATPRPAAHQQEGAA